MLANNALSSGAPIRTRLEKDLAFVDGSAFRRGVQSASVIVLALSLTCCASHGTSTLPVNVVPGRIVKLWNVRVEWTPEGLVVSGLAKRGRLPAGVLDEHIHADALDSQGFVLSSQDVRWSGVLSARSMESVRFRAILPPAANGSASVRVAVVPGRMHRSSE